MSDQRSIQLREWIVLPIIVQILFAFAILIAAWTA
jgi:hypothetical protein